MQPAGSSTALDDALATEVLKRRGLFPQRVPEGDWEFTHIWNHNVELPALIFKVVVYHVHHGLE